MPKATISIDRRLSGHIQTLPLASSAVPANGCAIRGTRMSGTTRRTLLTTIAGTAAASASARLRSANAQTETIRIGCITSLSGAQEIIGRPMLIGGQIAAAQINARRGLLGKKIEIVERDDKADPTQALTVGRELIGRA